MAAGLAHEINNPLAFVANNVAVLGRDLAAVLEVVAAYGEGRPELRPELAARVAALEEEADLGYLRACLPELVDATRRGLDRVAKIVQTLRDFAQVDRAPSGEVDVNHSLEQALALLGDVTAGRRIEVERDLGAVPRLEGAAADLNQVLLGLLMNGVQAIEDGGRGAGRLRVATRWDGAEVVVEVADDGRGIAPEALPRIFDPFFTTRPSGRGTGLGLSLASSVVAGHGGRIEVDTAVGVGSTFRVRLPVRRAAGPGP